MAAYILGFLFLGLIELVVTVLVADAVGWIGALLGLILTSAIGAWMVKREGIATWRRVAEGMRTGQMPADALIDGCIIVAAGTLALLPGYVSDVVALALLVPPVRSVVRRRAAASVRRKVDLRVATIGNATMFGFGSGPGPYRRPASRDDDVIDLDAEEVFLDEPVAEIEPPRDSRP